jgi:exopolyphosphatase / guanosine-5'-triphosphate,3'-diphosphate pyrophosphatase
MTHPDSPPPSASAAPRPTSPAQCRAVIDVGTNSVKLLVGEIQGASVRPLLETSQQTRLGQGFYPGHVLQTQAISRTVQVISDQAQAARDQGAESILVAATSAVRDAVNQEELLAAVRQTCGLEIRIISGDQEATWAFEGITTDPRFTDHKLFVLEVGGGSCQCIIGQRHTIYYRHSFRMGSVRLFEMVRPSDPPTRKDRQRCRELLASFVRQRLCPAIESVMREHPIQDMILVGSGGTCSLLAALEQQMKTFDRDRLEATRLSRTQVVGRCAQLWQATLEQRRSLPGLPPDKADIILMGAAIYLAVMQHLGFEELRVSTRGIRFGALVSGGD